MDEIEGRLWETLSKMAATKGSRFTILVSALHAAYVDDHNDKVNDVYFRAARQRLADSGRISITRQSKVSPLAIIVHQSPPEGDANEAAGA
jgi:hypothetical protein